MLTSMLLLCDRVTNIDQERPPAFTETMSDKEETSLHHSQTLKVKPSCHFSGRVQRVKECLTKYKYEVTYRMLSSLQDSGNLQKTLGDALLEYDVERTSVSEVIKGIFYYLRKKSNANTNAVACVLLEIQTGVPNVQITLKNNCLLERDYPCENPFDIRETSDTSKGNIAQNFYKPQPVAIIKQGCAWLGIYQETAGRQLIYFCCGSLDSIRASIGFGFRAESFDRIHASISRSIDASIDRKTVRESTQETRTVDGYIEENNLKMSREDRKRLFKLVNKYSEELMEKHSNLNRISVSPVISHRHGRIEEMPCIVMYCSCKSIRPHDEPEFPGQIEKVPVDVREGYCSLFGVSEANDYNDPLRTGISIGSHGMKDSGTLGPFVVEAENKTSVGFLTCQHVFQSAEIGRNVVQPTGIHTDTTICGKIRSMCFEDVVFNGKPTSVDVAYVALDKRIPKGFKFPDIPESMITEDFHGYPRMGQPTMHLKEDDIGIPVYKLGQASGLTEGCFDTIRTTRLLGKERVRNVYQVSSDYVFAVHGDSGSSVFTVNGNTLSVIGILLGGSDNKKECYVIPIGAALQALEPKLEINLFKDETTTGAEGSNDDHQSDDTRASTTGAQAGPIQGQSSTTKCPELSKSVKPFSSTK